MTYKETKTVGKLRHTANVRLNDKCKNGHQDFSVTVDTYEKRNGKWREHSFGCQHDVVKKVFPHLEIFVRLHLCDYDGVPMYATANGYYSLTKGYGTVKTDDERFPALYKEGYRLTDEQYELLCTANSEVHFAMLLKDSDILQCWKAEATEGIAILERLTGQTFVNTSTKSNLSFPHPDKVKEEEEKMKDGYYSEKAKADRLEAKYVAIVADWEKVAKAKYEQDKVDIGINTQLLYLGGKRFVDGCIVYSHSKEVKMNWVGNSSDPLSQKEMDTIKENVKLPKGYTFKQG